MKIVNSDEAVQISDPVRTGDSTYRTELYGVTEKGRIRFDFHMETDVDQFPFAFGARPFENFSNRRRPSGVGHAIMVVESIDVVRMHWPHNPEITPPEIKGWWTRVIVNMKAIQRNKPVNNEIYTLWESQLPNYSRSGMEVGLWVDFSVTPIDFDSEDEGETP